MILEIFISKDYSWILKEAAWNGWCCYDNISFFQKDCLFRRYANVVCSCSLISKGFLFLVSSGTISSIPYSTQLVRTADTSCPGTSLRGKSMENRNIWKESVKTLSNSCRVWTREELKFWQSPRYLKIIWSSYQSIISVVDIAIKKNYQVVCSVELLYILNKSNKFWYKRKFTARLH